MILHASGVFPCVGLTPEFGLSETDQERGVKDSRILSFEIYLD